MKKAISKSVTVCLFVVFATILFVSFRSISQVNPTEDVTDVGIAMEEAGIVSVEEYKLINYVSSNFAKTGTCSKDTLNLFVDRLVANNVQSEAPESRRMSYALATKYATTLPDNTTIERIWTFVNHTTKYVPTVGTVDTATQLWASDDALDQNAFVLLMRWTKDVRAIPYLETLATKDINKGGALDDITKLNALKVYTELNTLRARVSRPYRAPGR